MSLLVSAMSNSTWRILQVAPRPSNANPTPAPTARIEASRRGPPHSRSAPSSHGAHLVQHGRAAEDRGDAAVPLDRRAAERRIAARYRPAAACYGRVRRRLL
jgi:hypothetical protein